MTLRSFIFIFCILAQSLVLAKPKTLLECFGKEEEMIHREKLSKQAQWLNQRVISDIFDLGEFELKEKYFKEICHNTEDFKSLKFLEVFLRNKGSIFKGKKEQRDYLRKNLYEKVLTRLEEYISYTQMISPDPHCLFLKKPGVSSFLFKMLHERSYLTGREILDRGGLGLLVLRELKDFPSFMKNCSNKNDRI